MKKFKSATDIFAEVVSRVLDPVWELPVVILLAIVFAVKEGLRWRFLGLLLFIDAVIPVIFYIMMVRHKQISNWDADKRSQRMPFLIFTLLCQLGGLWLAHELGKGALVSILALFCLIGVVFVLITGKWKISMHAGANAVLLTMLNMFEGWRYWWLYGLLLLVMWARVYQKHHSWQQVIAGAVIGGGVVGVGLIFV